MAHGSRLKSSFFQVVGGGSRPCSSLALPQLRRALLLLRGDRAAASGRSRACAWASSASPSNAGFGGLYLVALVFVLQGLRFSSMARREAARQDEDVHGQSPLKLRRGDEAAGVTPGLLQQMLTETQAAIVQNQRELLREELQRLDRKNEERFGKVEGVLQAHDEKFQKIEKTLQALQARDVDGGSTTAGSADKGHSDRMVMIVGGWPRDSRKQVILDKMQDIIKDHNLTDLLDKDPFVTGPRRSYAMVPFLQRQGEHRDDCKDRMHQAIGIIMRAKIQIPAQDRPLWAAVSKSSGERMRASHCSLVRATVRFFEPNKLEEVDAEYSRGTCWIGDVKVSCSTSTCTDGHAKLWVDTSKDFRPWINVSALSDAIQADPDEILSFLQRSREDRQR